MESPAENPSVLAEAVVETDAVQSAGLLVPSGALWRQADVVPRCAGFECGTAYS